MKALIGPGGGGLLSESVGLLERVMVQLMQVVGIAKDQAVLLVNL